ncbi:ABC transporter ATP-binding protein [Paraburkholderia sp. SARCC-3016]|uniref:ABC transporter ATP-binding protein n=1 Tax=Paraburkholderia sp. SARCC-3016 TaxID=3058611 RepID=UPI0028092F4C|nr:ABC transporter ATP-binding protein [Paraburkholderia sp. SARCC-3016]MDQ7978068.1 ABC transporter ATP-binding protein [Paraburkholderia sp. SARCC-3016]
MSFDTVITVDDVSKRFEIYEHPRDQLKQFLLPRMQRLMGRAPHQYFKEFWALRNVSLTIGRGESFGIVGLNGSGKSTLLQMIAGTLTPTLGKITTEGRVAALLELGSGFNPEFSGRENVYMNGALLGFSREQVAERMESIQSFADIGDHFDRPLLTYSSGMQMRVAFAVATAFDPDILIIDEALAVGDAYFQQKCFHRMERFKERGGTLLFVSHDANTVKHLCDRAVLISHGKVVTTGAPKSVIDLYHGLIARKNDQSGGEVQVLQSEQLALPQDSGFTWDAEAKWTKATTTTSNKQAELVDVKLLDETGAEVTHIESESELTVQYVVRLLKDFERPAFGLIIRDRVGRSIFETSTYAMRLEERPIASGSLVKVRFQLEFNLRVGHYSFSVGVANKGFARSEFEERTLLMHDVEQIEVLESSDAAFYGGIFNMRPKVVVQVVE